MIFPFYKIYKALIYHLCILVIWGSSCPKVLLAQPTSIYIEENDEDRNRTIDAALVAHMEKKWVDAAKYYQEVIENFPNGVQKFSFSVSFKNFEALEKIIVDYQNKRFSFGQDSQSISPNQFIKEIFEKYTLIMTVKELEEFSEVYNKKGALGLFKSLENQLYLGPREYALLRLSLMPPEGKEAYRLLFDGKANILYEEWVQTKNIRPLQEIAMIYPLTSVGEKVMDTLGNLYFKDGNLDLAIFMWERILQLNPTGEIPRSLILGKIILARHLTGEPLPLIMKERLELYNLSENDRKHIFSSKINLGGESLTLESYLKERLPKIFKTNKRVEEWTAYGGDFSHSKLSSSFSFPLSISNLYLGAFYYTSKIDGHTIFRTQSPISINKSLITKNKPYCSPYYPLVYNGCLYLNGPNDACCLNLATKTSKWSFENPNSPSRYIPSSLQESLYTATIANGIYYVVFDNYKDTSSVHQEQIFIPPTSSIYAIEAQNGKILWYTGSLKNTEDDVISNAFFNTAPVVVGDKLFIGGTISTAETKAYIFAFDAKSGKPLWRRFLCSKLERHEIAPEQKSTTRPTMGSGLTEDQGLLFYCTNIGVIASVESETGYIRWLVKYHPESHKIQIRSSEGDTDTTWANYPPIVQNGRLYVTPTDSDKLFVFKASTGELYWRFPEYVKNEEFRYLMGVGKQGWVFLSGTRIEAFNWGDDVSEYKWSFDPPAPIVGRGVLCDKYVTVPTSNFIYRLDIETGKVVEEIPIKKPYEAGNILIVDLLSPIPCPDCGRDVSPSEPFVCSCGKELKIKLESLYKRYLILTGKLQFTIYRK